MEGNNVPPSISDLARWLVHSGERRIAAQPPACFGPLGIQNWTRTVRFRNIELQLK
jgi:hypothetical protein